MRCFLCGPREESQCPVGYWSSSLCCGIVLEPQKDRHLVVVGRLECLGDPWSYAGGSFIYWWGHISDIASQAEDAASRREQGRIYKITKLVYGRYRGVSDTPIMNKKGRLLMTEAEQDARWMEHFSEVLNRPPPPQIQICKR